jgi:ABC-type polysaccharide transport system permease subunit
MMWHITVPGILPTFFVILLLTVANLLNNGMQQYYVFANAMNKDYIEVLDLYVYNIGLKNGMNGFNYSFATAVGMLKSLISIVLLFMVNGVSKKVRGQSII